MKRLLCAGLCAVLLCGCTGQREELDRVMALRQRLLGETTCSFSAEITADHGNSTGSFRVSCTSDRETLKFTIQSPETIAGISGSVSEQTGEFSFGDRVLIFEPVAEGTLSPAAAPWILLKALRGGCITACTVEENLLRVSLDDSYEADALHLEVWLSETGAPVRAEIYQEELRVLTLAVEKFEIQSPSSGELHRIFGLPAGIKSLCAWDNRNTCVT